MQKGPLRRALLAFKRTELLVQVLHQLVHLDMLLAMAKSSAPPARIYTTRDTRIEHALATAAAAGLIDADASSAQKLHALVVYADEQLTAEAEREEKLAAYRELAKEVVDLVPA